MHRIISQALLSALLTLLVLMTGCGGRKGSSSAVSSADATSKADKVFRIGYQKWSALNVLRARGDLDKRLAAQGVRVEWLDFPAGPQMLEAMAAGSLDLGNTGDAPVAFALAAGQPIVYVANTPPGDETGDSRALVVPRDSPIHSVAELKGKRIAVQKGSATHNFLVQALAKTGVDYKDVHVVYLAPPDARPAFESGSVDAWAIWDPYLAIAQQATEARTLVNGKGIVTAGAFYLSSRASVRRHPDWIKAALTEADKTGRWIVDHTHEAAELLAPATHLNVTVLEQVQQRAQPHDGRYIGLRPVDAQVMALQQAVADNFTRIGLLPNTVDVRTGLLSPQEAAAVTPDALLSPSPPSGQARQTGVEPSSARTSPPPSGQARHIGAASSLKGANR